MLRHKHLSRKEVSLSGIFDHATERWSMLEEHLLAFMDNFDFYLFLYDHDYRQRLNDILERFTDEEFECFERAHSHRFTIN